MDNLTERDTLDGFLRNLDKRIARQERHTHHGVGTLGEGGMAISGDYNNATLFGSDGGVYTREVVAKTTPPPTSDFGGHRVVGSIWLQLAGAPVETCITFSDDFERADGPLGAAWMEGTPGHHFISGGGVAAVSDGGAVIGAWRAWWAEEIGAENDQFVEMIVSGLTSIGPDNYLEIYTQMSADGNSAQVAMLSPGTTYLDWTVAEWEGTYGDFTFWDDGNVPVDWSTSPTFTFRLESYTTGRQVLSINGSVVSDWVSPAFVTGPYVGFQVYRGVASISPRIESISGGCLEAAPPTCETFSDTFERADGPLGPNWVLGQGEYYYEGVYPFAIDDGAAVGTVIADPTGTGSPFPVVNEMRWADEFGPSQFIEVQVENIYPNGTVQLFAHGNDDDRASHLGYFFYNTGGDDVISIWLLESSDTEEVEQSFINFPRPASHPVTFRLEADGNDLRAYVDGTLAHSWTAPGTIPLGPRVGIAIEYGTTDPGGGIIEGSPRILSVTGGCLE